MTDESREFWECFIKKNISYKYKWWVHDPDRQVTSISEYALWKKRWISNTNDEYRTHLDKLQVFLRMPCKNCLSQSKVMSLRLTYLDELKVFLSMLCKKWWVPNSNDDRWVQDIPRQVTNISENAF